MNQTSVAIVTSLLAATAGCLEPAVCPDARSPAAHPPEGLGEVHVGQGDPYLSGPLAVRKLTVPRCEHGTPVGLLILAPEISGGYRLFVKGDVTSIFRYRRRKLMEIFQGSEGRLAGLKPCNGSNRVVTHGHVLWHTPECEGSGK